MDPQYIANVYCQKEKIATKSGDDSTTGLRLTY